VIVKVVWIPEELYLLLERHAGKLNTTVDSVIIFAAIRWVEIQTLLLDIGGEIRE
jgi:hypothetical protein